MNINDIYSSNWLKASDIGANGQERKALIESVDVTELDGKQKAVVFFRGQKKGLVLNSTNAMTISAVLGPDTNSWIGKSVYLYVTKVPYNGSMTDAIRVRAVNEMPQSPPPSSAPDYSYMSDDQIPGDW